MYIYLFVLIVGIFSFPGCGGNYSEPSARITNESFKPFYRATIEWEIAQDIDNGKLEGTSVETANSHMRIFDMPSCIRDSMLHLLHSVKPLFPNFLTVASKPRLLHGENSFKIYEEIERSDNGCIDTRIQIIYLDKSTKGLDWLNKFHKASIQGDKITKFYFFTEIEDLRTYPRITFSVKNCPSEMNKNHDSVQITYAK